MAWKEEDEFAPPQIQAVYRRVKPERRHVLYIGSKKPSKELLLEGPLLANSKLSCSVEMPEKREHYDLIILDACDMDTVMAAKTVSTLKFKNQKVLAIGYTDAQLKQMALASAAKILDGREPGDMNNLSAAIEELVFPSTSRA